MGRALMLNVPEEVYEPLAQTAERTGITPEQLTVDWLMAVSRHAAQDPLENFIGVVQSAVPDWADQHDKYAGQAVLKQHDGGS